jgi:protein tyrosine phosphatase (PTP) superfamily phosphohydrolase (DUF442 family)
LTQVLSFFENAGGAALGYSELIGIRYPMSHRYQYKVNAELSRGSAVDAAGLIGLHAEGFKSVVNLRAEDNGDAAVAQALGMNALHLRIVDNTPPTVKQMVQFLDFVTDPKNQPAFVHCTLGVGRTGVAIACYRMAVEGWTPKQAVAEAKQFGCKMPDQQDFIWKFGDMLYRGEIPGYPLQSAASSPPSRNPAKRAGEEAGG